MINPTPSDIGRACYYNPPVVFADTFPGEWGVITSYNDSYVFVQYGADKTSKSTDRRNLTWAVPDKQEQTQCRT